MEADSQRGGIMGRIPMLGTELQALELDTC